MTKKDVLIQIISEVTNTSAEYIRQGVDAILSASPNRKKSLYDQELDPVEAECLLASLREEKDGIVAWLLEGT